MKKIATLLIAAGALLAGCSVRYESTAENEQAREHGVRDLFTHNGCTVTEFYARNQYRYYTRCQVPGVAGADTFWRGTRPGGVAADGLGMRP